MCKGDAELTDTPSEALVEDVYEALPGTWNFDREEGIKQVGTSTEVTYEGSAARLTFQVSISFETNAQETLHTLVIYKNGVLQSRTKSQCLIMFQAVEQRSIDLTATLSAVSGDTFELFIKASVNPAGPSTIDLVNGTLSVLGGS